MERQRRKPTEAKTKRKGPTLQGADGKPLIPPAPRSWGDLANLGVDARSKCLVPVEQIAFRTDPAVLPAQPAESKGMFELVSATARRALALGITSREPNFHVFVAVSPEVIIEDDIVRFASGYAARREPPPDIAYVHDFDRPEAPRPLRLPAGGGPKLALAMDTMIAALKEHIVAVARTEVLRSAQAEISEGLEKKNKEIISSLETAAKTLGFGIKSVQGGIQTFPILHGKPLTPEQFAVLDESTKRALADAEERLTREVEKSAGLVRHETSKFEAERDAAYKLAAEAVIEQGMSELREALGDLGPDLAAYLASVEHSLLEDWEDLVIPEPRHGAEEGDGESEEDPEHAQRLYRYKVNPVVTHDPGSAPPVIYETNPTYPNLFGYLERRARFGALLTDFTRVRAGSILRASGGVLVVRASDLLTDPIIWERLKRVLRERQIGAEDPLGPLGLYATTLRPIPVPIQVRVVLVGSPEVYMNLLDADPDFASLFRVKVEVESSLPRTKESVVALDAELMRMAKEHEWGAFSLDARAKLLDLATRLAGERDRMSLCLGPIEETAAFASALAAARTIDDKGSATHDEVHAGDPGVPSLRRPFRASTAPPAKTAVSAEEVSLAWRERRERTGAAERHFRDLIVRGEVSVETGGSRVGVVNGLSVLSTGDVEFGQPMRITAVVALGREGLIDVEREAQLSGSIHTKGVAILRGYLAHMFGQERPLSLRAQLAFEQSYGGIDGDSASSAELFALLSALADVGIDQGIAVTGSINQLGAIQAIGGVCAKIEGFFDVCSARGLTGKQGVLMPKTNLSHLVLREDVVHAIESGTFHLYAVESVTQGIEILTHLPAGERDASGRFPAASVFGRVERRIIEIAERLREAEHAQPVIPTPADSREDASTADLGDGDDFQIR